MTESTSRIFALQKKIADQGLGAVFVSNHHNLNYLFSFPSLSGEEREAWGLATGKASYLFTDARYETKSRNQNPKGKIVKTLIIDYQNKLSDQICKILAKKSIKKLAFEQDDLTYAEFAKLQNMLNKIELVPMAGLVEDMRLVKDADELYNLTQACKHTDKILKDIRRFITIGVTERLIADKIEHMVRGKGLSLSFSPIIAIDRNSSIPHYNTQLQGSVKVRAGSIVLVDFGVKYRGYCADITRMFFVEPVADCVRNRYRILLEIQNQTLDKCRHNTAASAIDEFCRQQIAERLELQLPHSTGHGVGLQIHEKPSISRLSNDVLIKRQVFTIEPGIYIPNQYGMRIEDTLLIDEDGRPTSLTNFSKECGIL